MLYLYNNQHTFNEFKNVKKYEDESLESRYNNYLTTFKQRTIERIWKIYFLNSENEKEQEDCI